MQSRTSDRRVAVVQREHTGRSGADDDSLGFTIDPERAAPILRRLVKPTGSRARIYGRDGALILDSDTFYSRGEVLRYDLPPPDAEKPDALTAFWQAVKTRMRQYDLPLYNEIGGDNGKAYPEVASALTGTSVPIVRVNDKGELVVSVAVPVQRLRAVLGVLLLSTRGGDIDNIVAAERWGIVRVSLFAAAVTVVLSMILANTIAGPVQRLASATERVRHSVKARAEIHRDVETVAAFGAELFARYTPGDGPAGTASPAVLEMVRAQAPKRVAPETQGETVW